MEILSFKCLAEDERQYPLYPCGLYPWYLWYPCIPNILNISGISVIL